MFMCRIYCRILGKLFSTFYLKSFALLFSLSFNECKTFIAVCGLFRSIQNSLFCYSNYQSKSCKIKYYIIYVCIC